jgi:ssDNA-binding Zn-finger/Zn-ribbon topoisomerase 1
MINSSKDSEFFYFRSEFDKTLKMYFREIIDLSVLPPNLNLNIPVLSCLILLVEREIEIRDFPNSPPKRYSRDSFLDDIENIGIGVDRTIFDTVSELFSLGFIIENNDEIKPSESAFKLVNFINSVFPGMPGINFIAYLVQTIDEVFSDRKSLAEGKETFYQTLKSRSLKKNRVSENVLKSLQNQTSSEKKGISSKALKERLSQLRKSRTSSDADMYKKVQVKSIFGSFDKEDDYQAEEVKAEEVKAEEVKAEEVKAEEVKAEEVKAEEVKAEEVKAEEVKAEEVKAEEVKAEEVKAEEEKAEEVKAEEVKAEEEKAEEEKAEEVKAEEVKAEEVKAEEVKLEEVKLEEVKLEEVKLEEDSEEISLSEEEIAKKISMFENELAMTCPVCNEGKIIESRTEKGKIFYECSNSLCHFISWAKPFHFSCPTCNNPFLVEEIFPDGSKGLKCPRATCDYQQNDQKNPALSAQPKKKKKVIRRVKRKK